MTADILDLKWETLGNTGSQYPGSTQLFKRRTADKCAQVLLDRVYRDLGIKANLGTVWRDKAEVKAQKGIGKMVPTLI
jgi:hypothetical protein